MIGMRAILDMTMRPGGRVLEVPVVVAVRHRRSPCCNAAWIANGKMPGELRCSECDKPFPRSEVMGDGVKG